MRVRKRVYRVTAVIAVVCVAVLLAVCVRAGQQSARASAFYPSIDASFGSPTFSRQFYSLTGESKTEDDSKSEAQKVTQSRFDIRPKLTGTSEAGRVTVTVRPNATDGAATNNRADCIRGTYSNRTTIGSGFGEIALLRRAPYPHPTVVLGTADADINLKKFDACGLSIDNIPGATDGSLSLVVRVYGTIFWTGIAGRNFEATYLFDLSFPSASSSEFRLDEPEATDGHVSYYTTGATLTYNVGKNMPIPAVFDNGDEVSVSAASGSGSVKFTAEGEHNIVCSGADTFSQRFFVDRTAPKVTLNRSRPDEVPRYGADETVTIAIEDLTFHYAVLDGRTYYENRIELSTSALREEQYTGTAYDRLGHATSFMFVVDKTAPDGELVGATDGALTNNVVRFRWTESDATATLNGAPYTGNTPIEADGGYTLVLSDSVGNSLIYRFTIDRTAPIMTELPRYTNQSFFVRAADPHGVTIECTGAGKQGSIDADRLEVREDGDWRFRAIDDVGNATPWIAVGLVRRDDFGNAARLYNEYKATSFYRVNLPAKIYPDCYGAYTFLTQDAAMRFAVQKEWDYRVETLSGGRWSYVSIGNASVTMIYTDRTELDRAIAKYAAAYVSDRLVMGPSGSSYDRPTDDNLVTRPDALTDNAPVLPAHLGAYEGLLLSYVRVGFVWRQPDEIVSGNASRITARFVSDGLTQQCGEAMTLSYGLTFREQLTAFGAFRQGYYLVTESDLCGNTQQYLLCFDTGAPSADVTVGYGNGNVGPLNLNEAYIEENKNVLLFVSLGFDRMFDTLDEYTCIRIVGRNLEETYRDGDIIPTLCYVNGYYGKYTVTLYDRSYNQLTFVVKIAGEAPVVTHTSLTSDTRCRLTIEVGDATNALTDVRLYKAAYDGTLTELTTDDDGTAVSPENTVYVLRTGGKYILRISDVYGRVIETDPLFYMKGLPVGELTGVRDRGATNKDVSLEFEDTCKVILYRMTDGDWQVVPEGDGYAFEESVNPSRVRLRADESSSGRYKFFLYVTEDMNLYTEYYFLIDCIPPSITAMTAQGALAHDSITKEDFFVTWSDSDVTVDYYTSKTAMGALGTARYVKGTVLNKSAVYYFTARDGVGNESTLTVTIDNIVQVEVSGSYRELDGCMVSKSALTLTVNERTNVFECVSSNGLSVANGQLIEEDGAYIFTIEDTTGNRVVLTLIIDKLPPVLTFTDDDGNVVIGDRTQKSFTASCAEESVVVKISTDNKTFTLYNSVRCTAEGDYYFSATDRMGNVQTVKLTIDRSVSFTVEGNVLVVDGVYKTGSWFRLTITEPIARFEVVSETGTGFEPGARVETEGTYVVIIEDTCGNAIVLTLAVVKTPPVCTVVLSDGSARSVNGVANQAFRVTCDDPGVALSFKTVRGAAYAPYGGEMLTEARVYWFRASDPLGNVAEFTFTLDADVAFVVKGDVRQFDVFTFGTRSRFIVTSEEELASFVVTSDNGITFALDEAVTAEGVYQVEISDLSGNTVVLTLFVDQTPPTAEIRKADGTTALLGSATNQPFWVESVENDTQIDYATSKYTNYVTYNGQELAETHTYYFKLTDAVGNETLFSVAYDDTVSYKVLGGANRLDDVTYATKTWLAIDAAEPLTYESEADFGFGIRYDVESDFFVTLIDEVGNRVTLRLIVDKTAPQIELIGVAQNGTTGSDVTVKATGFSRLYRVGDNGKVLQELADGDVLSAHGKYRLRAEDGAGNLTEAVFMIDKRVDVSFVSGGKTLLPGQYVVGAVSLDLAEEGEFRLMLNGESIEDSRGMKTPGVYKAVALDRYGNRAEIVCTVLPPRAQRYTLSFPAGDRVVCTLDGVEVPLGAAIETEGTYRFAVRRSDTDAYEFAVTVDRQPPTVEIIRKNDSFVLKNVSKPDAQVRVWRDGEEIAASLNSEFTKVGQYRVVVTDACGNTTEYEFELRYVNSAGMVMVVIGGLLLVGGLVCGLLYRRRLRVR